MSLFDFVFGLTAVILGLGLAEMASRFQQLIFAGRRVRWAPEPVLLSAVIFMVIIVVWLGSWRDRGMTQTSVGAVTVQVLAIIWPYMVAAAVFPRVPDEGRVDLFAYYDQNRRFLLGSILIGQLLSWALNLNRHAAEFHGAEAWARVLLSSAPYYSVIPYILLMFIRWRWLNILALLFVLAMFVPAVVGVRLTG